MRISFPKYHGLGNDYFVIRPEQTVLTQQRIRSICHRNFGPGSDGILQGPFYPGDADYDSIARAAHVDSPDAPFAVRIFNPDGSEAEKSGNGLRIFTRYLLDRQEVKQGDTFRILTLSGCVTATIGPRLITVDMGTISFDAQRLCAPSATGEHLNQPWTFADGTTLQASFASIGNPHCVFCLDTSDHLREQALTYGPQVEQSPVFSHGTNVQFLAPIDRHTIQIEIWERGAGYTLASGSSSCAATAVAIKLGLCQSPVTVKMPGGELAVAIDDQWNATLSGPVEYVCDITMDV